MLIIVGGIHNKTTVCRGNIEGSTETMKQSNCCWYTFIYAVNTNKPHISGKLCTFKHYFADVFLFISGGFKLYLDFKYSLCVLKYLVVWYSLASQHQTRHFNKGGGSVTHLI